MTPARQMLDTDIVAALARHPTGLAAERASRIGWDGLCISIVVAAEVRFGLAKRPSLRLAGQVEAVLAHLRVLPLDVPAERAYGTLRAELEVRGQTLVPNDYLIAAHALVLGLPLVTANLREFGRVPGLQVENWLE